MQSSAMVAVRTTTMIVCLVAVPLAAVLGTTWPKIVSSAFGDRESRQAGSDSNDLTAAAPVPRDLPPDRAPLASEPQIAETLDERPEPSTPTLPRVRITEVRALREEPQVASAGTAPAPPIETAPLWNPPRRNASSPRGRQTTTHFVASAPADEEGRWRQPAGELAQDSSGEVRPRGGSLRKTVYSQPDEANNQPPTTVESEAARLAPVERVPGGGVLADGERRLRSLGATDYRLEAWGYDGTFYRCSCSVPLSPQGRAARHFEAIEAAPSQAVAAVIKQVETWRKRRSGL